jgi:hypothetical protein
LNGRKTERQSAPASSTPAIKSLSEGNDLALVTVPKMHPRFNLESDDLLLIP